MLGTVKLSIIYLRHKYCDIRRLRQVSHNLDVSQIPILMFDGDRRRLQK
jgi:hypothetical protein